MSEGDDIRDRSAGRFGDGDDDVDGKNIENTENEKDVGQAMRDKNGMNVENEHSAGNSWNV